MEREGREEKVEGRGGGGGSWVGGGRGLKVEGRINSHEVHLHMKLLIKLQTLRSYYTSSSLHRLLNWVTLPPLVDTRSGVSLPPTLLYWE